MNTAVGRGQYNRQIGWYAEAVIYTVVHVITKYALGSHATLARRGLPAVLLY